MYSMNGLGDSSREIFFDVQESRVYFDERCRRRDY
jgi:hypothetical protein